MALERDDVVIPLHPFHLSMISSDRLQPLFAIML